MNVLTGVTKLLVNRYSDNKTEKNAESSVLIDMCWERYRCKE